MAGEGTSIEGSHLCDHHSRYHNSRRKNQETAIRVVIIASAIAIFWGLGITSKLAPQIFATTQAQIIATGLFASAGVFIGIVGFSAIAFAAYKNPSSRTDVYKSLMKNTLSAFKDHGVDTSGINFAINNGVPPLRFAHADHAIQGKRDKMEDVSFCVDLPTGKLAGVLDGHGGNKVALLAAEQFPLVFPAKLNEAKGNVERAFRETFRAIQEQIKAPEIEYQKGLLENLKNYSTAFVYRTHSSRNQPVTTGATASIVYIDKKNRAFVATLGDTHTFGFEKREDKIQVYPLSPKLNWSSPQEARRAGILSYRIDAIHDLHLIPEAFEGQKIEEKDLRSLISGVNVSRALGNIKDPTISQEPIVTMVQLDKKKILLIGCDGVWDDMKKPKHFIKKVIESYWESPEKIAEETVKYAYRHKSTDNISALVLWASPVFSPVL